MIYSEYAYDLNENKKTPKSTPRRFTNKPQLFDAFKK